MTALALSVDELLARARAETGIAIDDIEAREPLSVLVDSLNRESDLHAAGAVAMQQRLLRLLKNRLRMQRDFAAHPEIAEQHIDAPIMICGMARTGSTKLQKLLAASGDFNWLPYWQAFNPALHSGERGESTQPRIAEAEEHCRWFDAMSPEAKYGHAQEAHEPDEESYMLEQSLLTPCFMGWADMPGYLQWLYGQDMGAQFRYLRKLMQYLQWQGLQQPGRRWVLKCPLYFGLEPEMLRVFPDASLVMTHRHPGATTASGCRLQETFHAPFTDHPVDHPAFLQGMAALIAQHLRNREQFPDIRFHDLRFEDIVAAPVAVCETIYAHCGIAPGPEAFARIQAWHEANPQNKFGVHKYALADFGFTDAMIDAAFGPYIQFVANLPHLT